ncbi:YveK family protein [Cohnella fermenti]|uniref:Lipopolysaccharide biosynthesis protein n=1 Tax=Cohnella fermenti TaxID=2565925 RepID=A0A4S4BZY1_9BACL|nr:Wzz/FepE/Etk N-terminal domain-containing protein [Cohnella fermenti]THF80840.1 lipopolysaccharide biosynthesis protein [Cohnella fermenti]
MSNELDLRDYFLIVRKRIWWIVSFVLIVTIAAGAYSKFVKSPVYEASTKIIVNRSSSAVSSQGLDLNEVNTNIKMIDTYKEIIKTPAILDKVVEQHPEFGVTADQLKGKISVSSVNNTQVMTLIVRDGSYEAAARMVNAVSAIFKEEIPEIFNVENVSILNEAKLDISPGPVAPNVPLNVIIAFVVSLMIAVGAAFLLEYLDDTIKTEEDVEAILGLPTLATIAKLQVDEIPAAADKAVPSANVPKVGELSRVRSSK